MADYSYAAIQIGGLIPGQHAAKAIVGALLVEGLCDSEYEARLALLTAIRENTTADFENEQVSGGTFAFINDAVRTIPGVSCATSYSQSTGYGAGYLGIDADGAEHTATGDGDMPTIPMGALAAAVASPADVTRGRIERLLNEARLASGYDMPPLSAPLPVLAWLDTGDERGEIEEDDGAATPDEIATAIELHGGDNINIDPDAKASRGDDGTWVQAWVLIPNDEEGDESE